MVLPVIDKKKTQTNMDMVKVLTIKFPKAKQNLLGNGGKYLAPKRLPSASLTVGAGNICYTLYCARSLFKGLFFNIPALLSDICRTTDWKMGNTHTDCCCVFNVWESQRMDRCRGKVGVICFIAVKLWFVSYTI